MVVFWLADGPKLDHAVRPLSPVVSCPLPLICVRILGKKERMQGLRKRYQSGE